MLIDTPGLSKPRSLLQERLNDLVCGLGEVDVVAVCFPANQHVGPGDEYCAQVAGLREVPKLVAVVTKTDLVSPERLAAQLLRVAALEEKLQVRWEHIVPCSARSGERVGEVAEVLVSTTTRPGLSRR